MDAHHLGCRRNRRPTLFQLGPRTRARFPSRGITLRLRRRRKQSVSPAASPCHHLIDRLRDLQSGDQGEPPARLSHVVWHQDASRSARHRRIVFAVECIGYAGASNAHDNWRGHLWRCHHFTFGVSSLPFKLDAIVNPAAYQALLNGAAWIDLSTRGKIRAASEDRARLLHAMTTNHIQQLVPGQGCYAFFLSAQGRILSDVNLFCLPEYFLLDTEPETRQKLFDHLDKFIIADDVTLEDVTANLATVNVEGPLSEQILVSLSAPIPAAPWGIEPWGNRWVARVNSTGSEGFSLFTPTDEKADLIAQLESAGAVEADAETADVVRLEHGKPRYGIDITETQIPQETQQMHALHFSKGCYLGQEIVERVRSRGHVNKMLTALEIEAKDAPISGTKVQSAGKDVGEITSAAFSPSRGKVVALAMLRVDGLTAKELTVSNEIATHSSIATGM